MHANRWKRVCIGDRYMGRWLNQSVWLTTYIQLLTVKKKFRYQFTSTGQLPNSPNRTVAEGRRIELYSLHSSCLVPQSCACAQSRTGQPWGWVSFSPLRVTRMLTRNYASQISENIVCLLFQKINQWYFLFCVQLRQRIRGRCWRFKTSSTAYDDNTSAGAYINVQDTFYWLSYSTQFCARHRVDFQSSTNENTPCVVIRYITGFFAWF